MLPPSAVCDIELESSEKPIYERPNFPVEFGNLKVDFNNKLIRPNGGSTSLQVELYSSNGTTDGAIVSSIGMIQQA